MLDSLHYDDFAKHLNTTFVADLGEGRTVEMTLIDAEDKSPSPLHEQFVLNFRGAVEAPVRQGTYSLHHKDLGEGSLFLVPIARDESGLVYEAIFNRLRSTEQ